MADNSTLYVTTIPDAFRRVKAERPAARIRQLDQSPQEEMADSWAPGVSGWKAVPRPIHDAPSWPVLSRA